jgi:hypothetical protein
LLEFIPEGYQDITDGPMLTNSDVVKSASDLAEPPEFTKIWLSNAKADTLRA